MTDAPRPMVRNVVCRMRLFGMCTLSGGLLILASGWAGPVSGPPPDVKGIRWAEPTAGKKIVAGLLKGGRATVVSLARRLQPPAKGGDADVRFALHAMALEAARPDVSDALRKAVRAGLLEAVKSSRDADVAAFLLRQLRFVADTSCVAPLEPLLRDAKLCDPAVAVVLQAGGDAAVAAVRRALAEAPPPCRVHLVQALGLLHDAESARTVAAFLRSPDRNLRLTALEALADCATPESLDLLADAGKQLKDRYERRRWVRACTRCAERWNKMGKKAAALRLLQKVGGKAAADASSIVALLDAKVRIAGPDSIPELVRYVAGRDPVLRAAALRCAAQLPPAPWAEALAGVVQKTDDPAVQSSVVTALGKLGPRAAGKIAAVLPRLQPDALPAAVQALGRIGTKEARTILLDAAASGRLRDVPEEALRSALAGLPRDGFVKAIVTRLPNASAEGKRVLSVILAGIPGAAARRELQALLNDPDPKVRATVLRAFETTAGPEDAETLLERGFDPNAPRRERALARRALAALCRRSAKAAREVIGALNKLKAEQVPDGLILASRIGGEEALAFVKARLDSPDPQVKDAAFRALCNWSDPTAVPLLAARFTKAGDRRTRVLLLRALVRAAASDPASGEKIAEIADDLWKHARSADEKRQIIGLLGNVRDDRGLAVLARALEDPAVRAEAAAAAVRAVCPRGPKDRGMITAGAWAVLDKLCKVGAAPDLVAKARRQMQSMPPTAALGNVALGKPVTSDVVTEKPRVPEWAVDGRLGKWDAWFGHTSPAHLVVDLQQTVSLGAVRVIFYWDGSRYYQYTVEASTDGRTWKRIVDASKNTKPSTPQGVVHRVAGVPARFLRLTVLKNSANPAVHVVEFEAYPAGRVPKQFPVGGQIARAEPPEPEPKTPLPPPDRDGFIPLFNGKDLTGWMGSTSGYFVENGVMVCDPKKGGMLLTEHQFRDFIFRFEFKLTPGANNGVAIRAPARGNPAYAGMEIQIIDNLNYERVHHYHLKPYQVHGSIYGVVPAKTGALKPPGEWNQEEIRAVGPHITVILNGKTIVDANLNTIRQTADGRGLAGHPGLRRTRGHIGWLGHGARVEFRNVRIKPVDYCEVPEGRAPSEARPLFNGRDLTGWTGLTGNPEQRARMTPEQLAAARRKADADMRKHWKVEDGVLAFDGKGHSIGTIKEYGDFDLWVDWKIQAGGDSGIYLRGSPQVQIWDFHRHPEGSGGLYNNRKHPNKPLLCADRPIGEWNRFRIHMVGEKVSVWLNGWLVVDNVVMENYWNRSKPIFPTGPIELQSHGSHLWFRNIYVREIPRTKTGGK